VVGRSCRFAGGAATPPYRLPAAQPSTLNRLRAFTLIEILVVVVLMSLIVLALMAVFNSTQAAFRASLTQTDVLEGGRSVIGLVKNDLEGMTPSFGQSNVVLNGDYYHFIPTNAPVNFCVTNNYWQYQSTAAPLVQSLIGASDTNTCRTNVLEKFFILTRQNTTWTGVGYVVDTTSANYVNPLYRFSATANVSAQSMPWGLYTNFLANTILPISPTNANMSHLVDGVVQLTVRAYDPNGYWMTNGYPFGYANIARNVWFSVPALGEVGFYMFSNTLPASVEIQLGLLEDHTIQHAESLVDVTPVWARSNYLSQQAGKVHLFRQRFPIRNVDPAAYQ
jgi:type II secretory pathway pseudopilin PulG